VVAPISSPLIAMLAYSTIESFVDGSCVETTRLISIGSYVKTPIFSLKLVIYDVL
jgi:hypothetical protein